MAQFRHNKTVLFELFRTPQKLKKKYINTFLGDELGLRFTAFLLSEKKIFHVMNELIEFFLK